MSAIGDFLLKTAEISTDDQKAFESVLSIVSSVAGMVSSAEAAVKFVESVLTLLGILQGPTDEIKQQISQLWNEFQDVLAATNQQIEMLAVAQFTGQAESALAELQQWCGDNPTGDPSGDWDGKSTVESDSLTAVTTLGQSAYWARPFYPELVYSDGWVQSLTPPAYSDGSESASPAAPGSFVFDYRVTMPAYLEVISFRLIILAALNRTFGEGIQTGLNSIVTQLAGYFETTRAGIVEHRAPHLSEITMTYINVGSADGTPKEEGESSQWAMAVGTVSGNLLAGNLFGVVERYSTSHLVDSWPATEAPGGLGLSTAAAQSFPYPKFLIRHLVRTLTRWKKMYSQIGLDKVASLLLQLSQLAGKPIGTIDGPTGDWAIKELAQRLTAIPNSGFSLVNSGGQQRISVRQMLGVLQTFNPTPYASLRAALGQ